MPDPAETDRAESARHYLFDGPLTRRLEHTLALIARATEFPTVRITVVDETTRYTLGIVGVGDPGPVPRSTAICDAVVRTGEPVEVPDAASDPDHAAVPDVVDGTVGAYLGVPLHGRESDVIGAVCVTDTRPREIEPELVARLADFAVVVEPVLEMLRRSREQAAADAPDPAAPRAGSTAAPPAGRTTGTDRRARSGAYRLGPDAPQRLAEAIRDGRIVPEYQPVVDLQSDRVRAYEVRPRWTPPGRPTDDARRLVPTARDTDLLVELDLAVLRRSLVDLRRWHRTWPQLQLTVPMSARVLGRPDCLALFEDAAESAGISPIYLNLLLTESNQWTPTATRAIDAATDLRDLGFGILLQDYGAGWTALDQLLWLPFDGVRIDAALTAALGTPVGDALAKGVIDLAGAMELRTTVAGVRSGAIADVARALGVDHAQGSFWAHPVPAAAVDPFTLERAIGDDAPGRSLAAAALPAGA